MNKWWHSKLKPFYDQLFLNGVISSWHYVSVGKTFIFILPSGKTSSCREICAAVLVRALPDADACSSVSSTVSQCRLHWAHACRRFTEHGLSIANRPRRTDKVTHMTIQPNMGILMLSMHIKLYETEICSALVQVVMRCIELWDFMIEKRKSNLHSFINSSSAWLYPGQRRGGLRAFPRTSGCQSTAWHLPHSFIHSFMI